MGEFGIGQPVPREEDPYLVRGAGRYVDDVQAIGQARGYVLRSPRAHAGIVRIDAGEARAKPGVLLILTGDDAEVLRLGLLQPHTPRKRRDGTPAFASSQPFLARERVRYLGDPVAWRIRHRRSSVVGDECREQRTRPDRCAVCANAGDTRKSVAGDEGRSGIVKRYGEISMLEGAP